MSWSGSSWTGGANKWQGQPSPTSAPATATVAQLGVKRTLTPTPISSAAGSSKVAYKVSTQTRKGDIVASTLVGDYEEKGTNHGKKFYQKIGQIPGHPTVKVFLYYWDARDGADFSGWWFGDQLGGTQVWSKASVHTPTPPKIGWRIPWDAAQPQAGALIVDPVGSPTQPAAVAAAAPTPAAATANAAALRLKKATADVTSAETLANAAINSAKKVLDNEKAPELTLTANADTLQKQQAKLIELHGSVTADIAEARKGGPAAASVVADLSKLLPKIKTLQTGIVAEVAKFKARLAKVEAEKKKAELEKKKAEAEKKKKEMEEQQKKQAEKDEKECQQLLQKAKAIVSAAESAADALGGEATPLLLAGEATEEALAAIETAATEALKKIAEARSELSTKVMPAVKKCTAEAQKTMTADLQPLQNMLNEAQKKANSYKNFKKDFPSFVEARKIVTEFLQRLDAADVQAARAEKKVVVAKVATMTSEEIEAVDEVTKPALETLGAVLTEIAQKSKGGSAALLAELGQARGKAGSVRAKVEAINAKLKDRRLQITIQKAVVTANEKVDAADASFVDLQQSEMPFLKGLEVLPKEESDKALGEADSTASKAQELIGSARAFMKAMLGESKKCADKELVKSVNDQFPALGRRLDAMDVKLSKFRKDTAERKVAAALADLAEPVTTAEEQITALKAAAKPLSDNFEEKSVDAIKEAIETCAAPEQAAIAACANAKKVVAGSKHALKSGDGATGVSKIQARLTVVQNDLAKHKQLVESANKLIKAKHVLAEMEAKSKEAEAELEKAESLAPGEDADMTEAGVQAMEVASANALKTLRGVPGAVQPYIATSPTETKAALQKLVDGAKEGVERLNKLKASTKTKREKVLVEVATKEGEAKVKTIEDNVEKMNEAEMPFLKGIEVLSFKESKTMIDCSEEVIKLTQESIAAAKSLLAAKALDAKSFAKEATAEVTSAFAAFNARIAEAQKKLSGFVKDTAERKKSFHILEAGEKVAEVEAEVKKTMAAAAPFMKEGDQKLSEAEALEPLKAYLESEKVTKAMMAAARAFCSERQRVSKENVGQMETIKQLLDRLSEAQAEMAKAKAATAEHEQRHLGKCLLEEVQKEVAKLDAEVKQANDACAPLLERAGEEFLVQTSIRTLGTALAAHMKEKTLDLVALFQEVGKGKKVKQGPFVQYLASLPEAIGHDELAFSEERRNAIFTALDADKDGAISAEDFAGIFRQRCLCKKAVTLTDGFSVADSKTVSKLEAGTTIETIGAPKTDEDGLVRSEVQTLGEEKQVGWATIRSNLGGALLDVLTPFAIFCKDADRAVQEAASNVQKVSMFLTTKSKQGGTAASGTPLAEAREEMMKLKSKVTDAVAAVEAVKKKLALAKKEYNEKEQLEINAHIHAKNAKEAATITSVAAPLVEAAEAASKAVETAAQPFTSLADDAVESFATPSALSEEVEKLAAAATEKTEEARKVVREQLEVAKKVVPPSGASTEAKRQLTLMMGKLDAGAKSSKKELDLVRARCKVIVNKSFDAVRAALQKEVQGAGGDAEKFFKTLAAGKSQVSEAAFCKKLTSLSGLSIVPEHAKLAFKRIVGGDEGVARGAFLALVQRYAIAVKDIALTDVFDVNSTKTLRKVEMNEMMEVLEGPTNDASIGVERVRVKSLLDGTEGWVTIKGNQGTAFLKDIAKPCYKLNAEMGLDKEAAGGGVVRRLELNEIVELVEGPRKHVFGDASFARVKATKDGATGWVSIKDRKGVEYVESNSKQYVCKTIVAITDAKDMKESKVLRKLAIGELFDAIEPVEEDKESGVCRVKGKAQKDGQEGWITIKGNAGTMFAHLDAKNFCVTKAVGLQKRMGTAAKNEVVRNLEEGESLQLLEGPKDEKATPEIRLKVCAQSDLAVGWISKDQSVKDWAQKF